MVTCLIIVIQLTLAISNSLISNNRLGAISPLFHNIFNMSLTSGVILHIHLLNVVVWFIVFLTSASSVSLPRSRQLSRGNLQLIPRVLYKSIIQSHNPKQILKFIFCILNFQTPCLKTQHHPRTTLKCDTVCPSTVFYSYSECLLPIDQPWTKIRLSACVKISV